MKLTQFQADCFKNLRHVSFQPHSSYNLILGENAQGKTNLLESIWCFTGCRSFRGTRERDYLPFDGGVLQVEAGFQDSRREQTMKMCMVGGATPEKKFWCNDIFRKGSELFSIFHCVIFTPEDQALVSGGPERRRTFLDMSGAQLIASLLGYVRRYQLVLQQRNALLKEKLPEDQVTPMLSVWDGQLARLGAEIAVQRSAYVRKLSETCVPLYHKISGGREEVSLHYQSSVYGRDAQEHLPEQVTGELVQQYLEKLEQSRQSDLFLEHTSFGIHRDDLGLLIDGKSAREFGSQGQKKSLSLALKLSQAEIYRKKQKESPIVLLDDVMGELDQRRQTVVSHIVEEMQVFVTTCHPESIQLQKEGKRFLVTDGVLTEA
ncbi:MAG: DNA replication/repair protein RecF [Ruminococcus sp.]|nr:DNA replication/repair protein RecF [Ruminococcus sp.]